MPLRHCLKILGIVTAALAPASASFGQTAEACGTSQNLLFHCTFHDGQKQVGVCLDDTSVSYQFGPDFTDPELSLSNRLSDIEHVSSKSSSGALIESIAMMNIDTRYEIVAASSPATFDTGTMGKIVVILPSLLSQTHVCDPGSVWPADPRQGIGLLSERLQATAGRNGG